MNDVDELADRLHELGERAPFPVGDPNHDIRRGRTALRRRRRIRGAVGVTAALAAVGLAAASLPALNLLGSGDTVVMPAGGPSKSTAQKSVTAPKVTSKSSSHPKNLCVSTAKTAFQPTPAELAAVKAYHETAVKTLDPSGKHLDPADKAGLETGGGGTCDPKTGPHGGALGTKIGWNSGGQLGVIEIEVDAPDQHQPGLILTTGWKPYDGPLPTGIAKAKVVDYSYHGQSGHTVLARRADGSTVVIDANPFWGNNDVPGSPPATGLPGVQKLLELAASPMLTWDK